MFAYSRAGVQNGAQTAVRAVPNPERKGPGQPQLTINMMLDMMNMNNS
jgi:hypothetical protein